MRRFALGRRHPLPGVTIPSITTTTQPTIRMLMATSIRFASNSPQQPPKKSSSATPTGFVPQDTPFTDADMTHFKLTKTPHPLYVKNNTAPGQNDETLNPTPATVWTEQEVRAVTQTHVPKSGLVDYIAYAGVKFLRIGFDVVSGYMWGHLTPSKILRRILFLETAAGIPGMVAGSIRHLKSLRLMRRDRGWIHTLLEEAENERMHMLVFMQTHKPGLLFRASVLVTQGIFWNVFFFSYLLSPQLCHRFVGYLEEEAVRTYSHIIDVMESTKPEDAQVREFGKTKAPEVAIRYWKLKPDASMYDVMLAVRADEANHRDVNHTFASIGSNAECPFASAGHKH
eukprot:PhF_6_TR15656/c1_g1_i2/m.24332